MWQEPAEAATLLKDMRTYRNVFKGKFINVRSAPSVGGATVGQLAEGDECQVTATRGDWVRVVPPSGVTEAWVLCHHPVHGELFSPTPN